jgi:hypothetical protein
MIRSLAGSIYVFLKTLLFFEWCYQINGMDLFSWHITLNCFHSFNCALYGNVKLGQSDEDQGRRLKNAYINRARRMRMRQGKVMICHWWREKYFVMSRKNPWGGGGFATALSQLPSADSNSNQRGSILRGEGIKKREKKKKKRRGFINIYDKDNLEGNILTRLERLGFWCSEFWFVTAILD